MDVELIRIRGGKGNSIDLGFLEEINRSLDASRGAVVLTGEGKFFSAGLSLTTLWPLDRAAMKEFIGVFNATMQRLWSHPRPVVAAINGHAIAGGCVLALQCDARIMADVDGRIGLNEAAIGIGLPTVVLETLRAQVPVTSIVPIAYEGGLFTPARARELGLVDEVVPAGRLEERALERARQLAAVPAEAYAFVKKTARRPVLEAVQQWGAGDDEAWLDTWFSKDARERIGAAVAKMSK